MWLLKHGQPGLHQLHVLSTAFPSIYSLLLSQFSLWIILLPPSLSPLIFPLINQSDRCRVPLVWLEGVGLPVMAVYSVTLSTKVEAPGHPGHPPPLSKAVVNCK